MVYPKVLFHYFLSTILILICLVFHNEPARAGESDIYDFTWLDPDKEVFVLQNRKFRKAGMVNASVGAGFTTSGAFVDAQSYQGRASYYFVEDWGIEFLYAKNDGKENTTALSVRNPGGAGSTPFRRIVQSYYGAMAMWSPFYAKINTFNTIIYFDWLLGLGAAKVEEKNNRKEFSTGSTGTFSDTTETHTALLWQTGLKFYLSRSFDIRLDLTALNYQAQKALSTSGVSDKQWFSNYDLSLSFGVRF